MFIDDKGFQPTQNQNVFNTLHSRIDSNIDIKLDNKQLNSSNQPEVAVNEMNPESIVKLSPVMNSEINNKIETDDDSGPEEVKIQRELPTVGTIPHLVMKSDQPCVDKSGNSSIVAQSKDSCQNKFKKPFPTVKRPLQHPMYRRKRFTLLEKVCKY